MKQLYLFPDMTEQEGDSDMTILFHIKRNNKERLADQAKLEGLSVTGLLNRLIADYISGKFEAVKKAVTGRGHRKADHELVKDYLRSIHPNTARKIEISKATGIKQDRMMIILNNLSGLMDDKGDIIDSTFIVYEDDESGYTTYGIARDDKLGIDF